MWPEPSPREFLLPSNPGICDRNRSRRRCHLPENRRRFADPMNGLTFDELLATADGVQSDARPGPAGNPGPWGRVPPGGIASQPRSRVCGGRNRRRRQCRISGNACNPRGRHGGKAPAQPSGRPRKHRGGAAESRYPVSACPKRCDRRCLQGPGRAADARRDRATGRNRPARGGNSRTALEGKEVSRVDVLQARNRVPTKHACDARTRGPTTRPPGRNSPPSSAPRTCRRLLWRTGSTSIHPRSIGRPLSPTCSPPAGTRSRPRRSRARSQ